MFTCKFCGHSSTDLEDFEPDEKFNKGFWCPYCDGFTYFEKQTDKHNFALLMENPSKTTANTYKKPDFPSQVSPLRYPGGKSKFVGPILSKCNTENMVNFVEPFAGGASVGLSLLLAGKIQNLYLNDSDFGIYSLFYMIKYMPEVLIEKIRHFRPSQKAFLRAKNCVNEDYYGLDISEAAWVLLVCNRLAFSGICKANCMGNPSARWNPDKLSEKIMNIHRFSDRIQISNIDACEFIEEMYWRSSTTIFVDPPYYVKGKALYNKFYTHEDHLKLSVLLDELHKGMPGADMIVTYDYCEEIENMYYYPTIETVGRKYSIAN